ncbi:MAG: DUF4097 family beta strand repeat-containing protein [Candidatus Promineifilaceae bacterium]
MKERYETGKTPTLIISADGDLQIRGWDEPAVQVHGPATLRQEEAKWRIEASDDVSLLVPRTADVILERVAGEGLVKHLETPLTAGEVAGDLSLTHLASATVQAVHGDLSAGHLEGAFSAAEIMGDASLRHMQSVELGRVHGDLSAAHISGALSLESIMGDSSLASISGPVEAATVQRDANVGNLGGSLALRQVHGDVRLRGPLAEGKHTVSAEGDIVLIWPAGAPLNLEAKASKVVCRLPLDAQSEEAGVFSGRLGDGNTTLLLEARGRVILKALEEYAADKFGPGPHPFELDLDLASLGDRINAEISGRMADLGGRLEREFGPAFAAKLEMRADKAAARAERMAARAMRKAERAARKMPWRAGPPIPGAPAAKAQPRASDDEQLKILKMVEQGVITPDEANNLLEALEGA